MFSFGKFRHSLYKMLDALSRELKWAQRITNHHKFFAFTNHNGLRKPKWTQEAFKCFPRLFPASGQFHSLPVIGNMKLTSGNSWMTGEWKADLGGI